jgi:hypothetical protein
MKKRAKLTTPLCSWEYGFLLFDIYTASKKRRKI